MRGHSAVLGRGPETFTFSGSTARVSAFGHEVQGIVNHFKAWLPNATRRYKEMIVQEQQEAIRREREETQKRIEHEEERQRILKNLKI